MRIHAVWLLLLSSSILAADAGGENLIGSVEVGYRNVDVNGNVDKYREHINLDDDALRLFAFDLGWTPEDNAVLDRLEIDARNLGGEPHGFTRVHMQKANVYDLDLRYRTDQFFYRDAGWYFNVDGDLHTRDTERRFFDGELDVDVTKKIRIRVGGDYAERNGGSTTTRYLQDDVFVLDRPLDQEASSFWVAADFRVAWAEISLEQRFTSWENRWSLSTVDNPGASNQAATLDRYLQRRNETADVPITRLSARGRPLDWFRFSLAVAAARADLNSNTVGAWSGQDADSTGFQTSLTNIGKGERDSDLIELDLWFGLLRTLDLIVDLSRRSYVQDGTIDSVESQTGGAGQGLYVVRGDLRNELELETYGLALEWRPVRNLSVAGGVGWQQRTADFPLAGPPVETERRLYRAGLNWRASRVFDLRVKLEQGDDDRPYTVVSPTSLESVRLAAHVRPIPSLDLSLTVLDQSRENDLTYPLSRPTDDTPSVTDISLAKFDVRSWTFNVAWARGPWDVVAAYTSADIDSDAHIVYITQATSPLDVQTTRQTTGYVADQDVVNAHLRYTFGRGWRVGLDGLHVDNKGSFPVERSYYGADLQYEFSMGLYARLAFGRHDYAENNPYAIAGSPPVLAPGINDYDADLLTLYLGYRF